MAIVKHIKSRNANYSATINYLLFEHDEKTGKKIVDESGRSILRKEFYMDGLNCDPMSFDKECELTNTHFHKNKKREDIKSHHYIISYDPADVTENGLTGKRAQAISLELAKQIFPGYQALVVTHTDGHNESGNIHTHIVINSVRKTAVERQPYMDKPHEEAAGYKHRSTDKFMNTSKKTIMDRCQQEGLHQIDLLAPAERKISQKEYMAQKHGQQKLDEINQKIIEDGLKPTSTVFLTQKEYLRNAIDECAATSNSFDEFQSKLLEQFQISVIEHRGRYSYLHPDRQKRITERALETRYGKAHLEQTFLRKGYYFMSCKTIYVMISSFLSEEEKMIVAAHELGHIILHRSQLKMAPMQDDTLYNMTDNTEYQANLFAADLLIDDEEIEDMVQNEDLDYFGLCSSLNATPELMSFKLYSLTKRGQAYHMPMEIQSNFLAK